MRISAFWLWVNFLTLCQFFDFLSQFFDFLCQFFDFGVKKLTRKVKKFTQSQKIDSVKKQKYALNVVNRFWEWPERESEMNFEKLWDLNNFFTSLFPFNFHQFNQIHFLFGTCHFHWPNTIFFKFGGSQSLLFTKSNFF